MKSLLIILGLCISITATPQADNMECIRTTVTFAGLQDDGSFKVVRHHENRCSVYLVNGADNTIQWDNIEIYKVKDGKIVLDEVTGGIGK